MTFPFPPHYRLVLVEAELEGPTGNVVLRLALDTGATVTVLSAAALVTAGYDLTLAPSHVQVTTGSGVESVPVISVSRLKALGQERTGFPVLGHTLPVSAGVDGVLGLDFLRGLTLTVDFRLGQIALA
jgi:predicted aspartyl protease